MPKNDYAYWDIENANPPFYYPKHRVQLSEQFLASGYMYFGDAPARHYKQNNYYWRAELSLVGYKKGQWHHIETFRYGFEVRNNIVMPYQFQRGQKPYYNSYLINKLNK